MENCCNYVWNKRIYTTVFFWALDLYVNFIYTRHQYTRSLFLWALDWYVNFIYIPDTSTIQFRKNRSFFSIDNASWLSFFLTIDRYNVDVLCNCCLNKQSHACLLWVNIDTFNRKQMYILLFTRVVLLLKLFPSYWKRRQQQWLFTMTKHQQVLIFTGLYFFLAIIRKQSLSYSFLNFI